ncbi:MAG: HAMP domain-containing sensor histidine kinase [Dysgonomonas sp.]|nr:HAMP domain-containing sensor histidine kinase [Dysgonomonas sp.]
MKEANVTRFSILLVIVIFLAQVFLVYRLYQSNLNLLEREINLAMEEVYQIDLNRRVLSDGASRNLEPSSPKIKYIGDEPPPGLDTTKIVKRTNIKDTPFDKNDIVKVVNLSIEEYLSQRVPIDLQKFDSIVSIVLKRNGIEQAFYSEIVDKENNKIIETSHSSTDHSSHVIISRDVPLDTKQTKVLRLVLVNPMTSIYYEMFGMLILSVIICVICIYSYHYHRKTLAKQRQVVQLKNDVFSDISHEFKRPLSTLMQIMSSLENEKIVLNEERRTRYLKMAVEEINKMSGQTDMILSMAMDDEGVLELNPTEINIENEVYEIVDRFTETSSKPTDIEVISNVSNPLISGDKYHIEHIITNLISNAIKYSKTPVEISVELNKDNNWLYISVKDNGIGISEGEINKIFDRYSRAGDTKAVKGHGIGLNYVRRMIKKHNGEISVESELDKGSKFIIKLPISKKYRN